MTVLGVTINQAPGWCLEIKEGVMPKEVVKSEWFGHGSDVQVEVHWKPYPAGHVQIATVLAGDDKKPSDRFKGLYASLNRDEINTVIRNLRRARDRAFGRDE